LLTTGFCDLLKSAMPVNETDKLKGLLWLGIVGMSESELAFKGKY
jgi:hypothetical protein